MKVVEHSISYKKLSGCLCLSPPGVELGGSKDVLNWESTFSLGLNAEIT